MPRGRAHDDLQDTCGHGAAGRCGQVRGSSDRHKTNSRVRRKYFPLSPSLAENVSGFRVAGSPFCRHSELPIRMAAENSFRPGLKDMLLHYAAADDCMRPRVADHSCSSWARHGDLDNGDPAPADRFRREQSFAFRMEAHSRDHTDLGDTAADLFSCQGRLLVPTASRSCSSAVR